MTIYDNEDAIRDLEVTCKCGKSLSWEINHHKEIIVQPCEDCMAEAYDNGYDSGIGEGESTAQDEAYDEGYEKGLDEGGREGYQRGLEDAKTQPRLHQEEY